MPNTILVPTDFSANSRAGIRFALQLELQGRHKLVFFHCLPFLKPTRWSDARYKTYVQEQKEEVGTRLHAFVAKIYRSAGVKSRRFNCVVEHHSDVVKCTLQYAQRIAADAICMSTRGAGTLRKLIGTHASGMIQTSPIPVFVIPGSYRRSPISEMLYASDLSQVGTELKIVRAFSRPLKAKVSVYHYDFRLDAQVMRERFEKVIRQHRSPEVSFVFPTYNVDKSLAEHLIRDARKSKANLAVLFTEQKRGWLERIFMASKSTDMVYDSKIPLLIIPKT